MDYNRLDVPMFSESESIKDCKKTTPDFMEGNPKKGIQQVGFKTGNVVAVTDVVSLANKTVLNGEFIFDSYNNYDNTCYVTGGGYGSTTFSVLLNDITFVSIN